MSGRELWVGIYVAGVFCAGVISQCVGTVRWAGVAGVFQWHILR